MVDLWWFILAVFDSSWLYRWLINDGYWWLFWWLYSSGEWWFIHDTTLIVYSYFVAVIYSYLKMMVTRAIKLPYSYFMVVIDASKWNNVDELFRCLMIDDYHDCWFMIVDSWSYWWFCSSGQWWLTVVDRLGYVGYTVMVLDDS